MDEAEQAVRTALDPAHFSREHFAWDPYPYQRDVLDAVLLHDKRRLAWVAGRRVGKTEGVANLVLQLAVKRPGIEIVIFAPSMRQARVLSRKVRHMLAGSRWEEDKVVDNVGELRLGFGRDEDGKPMESVIRTLSLSGKVRGEGADVLIVDESAFCDPEDYRNKALPFIADRPEAIVIHISTIWAEDDHFMDAYRRYPELDHGAAFRTPTREKPGVTEAMLEEFKASMTRSEFEREYECNLVPEGGVFDRKLLGRCLADYELRGLDELGAIEPELATRFWTGEMEWGHDVPPFKRITLAYVFHFGFHTGVRAPSEIVALDVQDVDRDAGEIVVTEKKKRGKRRWMPLPPYVIDAHTSKSLGNYIDCHRDKINPDTDAAFVTPSGDRWDTHYLRTELSRLGKRVWPDFHPYTMRRYFATEMLIATDFNVYKVAEAIGDEVRTVEKHYLDRARARPRWTSSTFLGFEGVRADDPPL